MSKFFIRRPIFAIVISIIIVLLGTISLLSLPIAQYPQISPPTISLSASYTGANATIVNQTVAQVIEEQLNGLENMSYMSSTSSNDGSYSLSIVFDLSSDGDTDSVNVQNNANLAKNSLPSDVQTTGLTVRKSSGDMVLMANLYSPNGTYDQAFLKNYADIYLLDKIQRINGVGNVNTFGSSYAMRVWLNPDKLAERNLTVSDVISAIKEQNISAPAGTVGGQPAPEIQEKQYSAKVEGRLTTPEQFGNIILKSASNGQFVYLKDVAKIETGTQNASSNSKINGKNGIGFGVQLTNDANALDTISQVKQVLSEAKENFPPDLDYIIVMDNTSFINASISEVKDTFVESLLLVILVVFIFLQKWRTTLIPVLAVPVSIVGTFATFIFLDFTINTLTLFAMVLAIGLVVDDAIVVIENVEEHMSKDGLSAKEATERAMVEVQGPIIATTAVLASIFIPVAFIGGVTGVLYKQFAITITVSVAISAFVALTLTPALCGLLLKSDELVSSPLASSLRISLPTFRISAAARPSGYGRSLFTLTPALCGLLLKSDDKGFTGGPLAFFFRKFNSAFESWREKYTGKVGWMIHHLKYAVIFLVLVTGLMGLFYQLLPSTFVPEEDQGFFMASVTMPEGTSLNQTVKTVDAIADETKKIPGVKDIMTHAGGSTSNSGNVYISLDSWDQRTSSDLSVNSIIAKFNKTVVPLHPEARVAAFNTPALPGLGMEGGWTMQLQDNVGLSDTELGQVADQVVAACSARPELSGVRTSYATNTPSVQYAVDREKIKNLGISLSDVFTALQANFGGSQVNDFNQFGRAYKVIVQADTQYRSQADSLKFISVKSASGKMVPLDTLLTSSITTGPSSITRFNGVRSVTIQGSAASGYSSGEAMKAAEEAAKSVMPSSFTIEWSGQSREESTSSSSTMKVLIMALIFAFLCLAALYESWSMPFAVLFTVPTGIFGAVFSEYIIRILASMTGGNATGFLNSVYMQIGIIMIIGLAAKNAILIVEFAKERVDKGMDPMDAVVIAAKLRLRPILMTAFTAIIGCLPLALATGAGAGARCGMGVAVVGGMTFATLCGLFLIPAFYIVSEYLARYFRKVTGFKGIKFKHRMLRR